MPLVEHLIERRHTVDFAADMSLAQRLVSGSHFHVVILGQAPGGICHTVLASLRQSSKLPVPVLMLGARGGAQPCEASGSGTPDGYLHAPYTLDSVDGMLAVLRRRGQDQRPVLRVGGLEMDVASLNVECGGAKVCVERALLPLLRTLLEAWPRPVPYQELVSCVSREAGNLSLMLMHGQMDMLRSILEEVEGAPVLQQRQTGYRLVQSVAGRR